MSEIPRTPEGPEDPTQPPLQDPDATLRQGARAGSVNPARLPAHIGPYRILGLLGSGGMGVVYEAEQASPHRRVALKVMRQAALVTEAQAQLFRREVETLGRLKHPNVATIFESGRTEDGLEFYAMEMVQGLTLDEWLAQRPPTMTPRELKLRLRLFRVICEAVHYAHLRGVIHRDLKPANIMVLPSTGAPEAAEASGALSTRSGDPSLKILDFGLARLVDPEGQAPSLRTELGVIMGTLQYMSPEQARGDSRAVDLRTDIYALGMILHEMMSGRRPYELGKAALTEAVRMICEQRPDRLVLSMSGARRQDADLATIVEKSLEKEPDRRYPSAGALAEDVERYLTSQPIVARPQSRAYRARLFVRRHLLGVGAVAGFILLLAAFGVAMAIQSRRIAHEAAVSQRMTAFLTRMFKVSDPSEARGNAITAREILDKASRDIGVGLQQDPEIRARLQHTMGTVHFGLGLYTQAEALLDPSVRTLRGLYGLDHPETLSALADLATVYVYQGRLKDSDRIYQELLPAMRRRHGAEHPDTLLALKNWCAQLVDQGRYPEAERTALEVRQALARIRGAEHPETLKAGLVMVNVYHFQGRTEEAVRLARELLGIQRRVLGPDHPGTLDGLQNLGVILVDQGHFAEAEALCQEAIAIKRRVLGADHPETLATQNNLAIIYYRQGRYAECEALYLALLPAARRVLGPRHPDVGNILYCLACLEARKGNREGAIRHLQAAVAATLPVPGALGMGEDEDLAPLRSDPRFQALVAEIGRTYKP